MAKNLRFNLAVPKAAQLSEVRKTLPGGLSAFRRAFKYLLSTPVRSPLPPAGLKRAQAGAGRRIRQLKPGSRAQAHTGGRPWASRSGSHRAAASTLCPCPGEEENAQRKSPSGAGRDHVSPELPAGAARLFHTGISGYSVLNRLENAPSVPELPEPVNLMPGAPAPPRPPPCGGIFP